MYKKQQKYMNISHESILKFILANETKHRVKEKKSKQRQWESNVLKVGFLLVHILSPYMNHSPGE